MSSDALPPEDGLPPDEALALDYALGGLDRGQRRDAEVRMRSDPVFRALVERWQAQLAPLDDATPPLAPPPAVWAAIAAEISPTRASAATAAPLRAGLWNSLMLWRGLAAGGIAAAITSLIVLPSAPVPAPAVPQAVPQLLVAALAGADGKPLLSAAYDPLRGAVVLTPATQRDDAGKSAELWVIEGEAKPRSLGVIDIKGANAHAISSKQLTGLRAGATLAISIEPLGGSPTGQPTGPVVATGTLQAI